MTRTQISARSRLTSESQPATVLPPWGRRAKLWTPVSSRASAMYLEDPARAGAACTCRVPTAAFGRDDRIPSERRCRTTYAASHSTIDIPAPSPDQEFRSGNQAIGSGTVYLAGGPKPAVHSFSYCRIRRVRAFEGEILPITRLPLNSASKSDLRIFDRRGHNRPITA